MIASKRRQGGTEEVARRGELGQQRGRLFTASQVDRRLTECTIRLGICGGTLRGGQYELEHVCPLLGELGGV